MVEMSSGSRKADQGTGEAGDGAGRGIGDWLAVLDPRDAIRRSAAFAVSKA